MHRSYSQFLALLIVILIELHISVPILAVNDWPIKELDTLQWDHFESQQVRYYHPYRISEDNYTIDSPYKIRLLSFANAGLFYEITRNGTVYNRSQAPLYSEGIIYYETHPGIFYQVYLVMSAALWTEEKAELSDFATDQEAYWIPTNFDEFPSYYSDVSVVFSGESWYNGFNVSVEYSATDEFNVERIMHYESKYVKYTEDGILEHYQYQYLRTIHTLDHSPWAQFNFTRTLLIEQETEKSIESTSWAFLITWFGICALGLTIFTSRKRIVN